MRRLAIMIEGGICLLNMRGIQLIRTASKLGPKVEIFIDAIDIFADDHTSSGALSIIRAIQKLIKTNKGEFQNLNQNEADLMSHFLVIAIPVFN